MPSSGGRQDLISNSPYCLPYGSCDVSLENLVLDQLIIPFLRLFFILITCLLDIVLTLLGEILSWSLVEVKGLICREKFSIVHSCNSEKLAYLEPIYPVNVVIMLSESLTWEHLGQCSLCKDHSKQSWLS